MRWRVVAQTLAVDVTQHGGALRAARPVVAGPIFAGREGAAIGLRPGERVVTIGGVAAVRDHGAPFRQRALHVELIIIAMKVIDILRDDFALKILPRPSAYMIPGINSWLSVSRLGAQIGSPCLAPSTRSLRQLLTIPVRPLDAAEIGTLAWTKASDEKRHWWTAAAGVQLHFVNQTTGRVLGADGKE